ncbi:ELMO domain-containing protein 1 [Trichinella spiralis]|uniref:ELMO domain-containing protein 1 n=1 Tax=Trichinella spiralis TaxID=6334 RepID=UPI0001EFB357|nr:ELMO domain-containing protein 1 [Trichinella spiralis]
METTDWALTNFTHVARISENLNAIIEQDRLKRSDPLSAFIHLPIQTSPPMIYGNPLPNLILFTHYSASSAVGLLYVLEKKIPKHDRVLQVEAILRKWKVFDFETISKCSLTEIYKTLATLCSENNLHNRKLKTRLKYCLQKIIAYEKLLKDVEDVRMIHYNPHDKAHESQLLKVVELLHTASNGVCLSSLLKPESQISAIDPRWVELGFQGKDPSTDFRGMGLLGLQQLIYLCETEQQKSLAMLSRSLNPRHGYPFAIVGINMSFLTRELLREGHLKSFFYAKSTCKFPMQDLHDVYRYCFYRFDQLWAIHKPENEMAFGEIRAQLKADLLSELRAVIISGTICETLRFCNGQQAVRICTKVRDLSKEKNHLQSFESNLCVTSANGSIEVLCAMCVLTLERQVVWQATQQFMFNLINCKYFHFVDKLLFCAILDM